MSMTTRDIVKPIYSLPKGATDDTRGQYAAWGAALLIATIGAFIAAADTANVLGGRRVVGPPSFGTLYTPSQMLEWLGTLSHTNQHVYNQLLNRLQYFGMGVVLFAGLGAGLASRYLGKPKMPDHTNGSARFLYEPEVTKLGLFANNGIYLGKFAGRDIRSKEEGHTLVVAPPGLGKTTGVVIPTMLEWRGPAFVYDTKGEIYDTTAGYRSKFMGSTCLRLDFMDATGKGAHYNFLDTIRLGTINEIGDIENIVTQLSDPDGKGQAGMTATEQHFINIGSSVLTATILHVLYSFPPSQRNLGTVNDVLSDPDAPSASAIFEEMKIAEHDKNYSRGWKDSSGRPTNTHPYVAKAAQDVIMMTETERSGCINTAKRFLIPFRNPLTAEVTSRSDFTIMDLRDKNITLYLVVDPENKDTLRPVVRLLINQFIRKLVGTLPDGGVVPDEKRILFLIDEFDSLKRLSVFEEAINYIRGYGLTALLIIQGFNQLFASYGKDERISAACANLLIYTPNDIETMRRVSDMVGQTTVRQKIPGGGGKNQGPRYNDVGRPLLRPEEVRILPREKSIIFLEGQRPIMADKVPYYQHEEFKLRAKVKPSHRRPVETVA
jgi:type IV secretion system protein VirD4